METMFQQAVRFNKEIRYWNIDNVVSFTDMFLDATDFKTEYSADDTPTSSFFIIPEDPLPPDSYRKRIGDFMDTSGNLQIMSEANDYYNSIGFDVVNVSNNYTWFKRVNYDVKYGEQLGEVLTHDPDFNGLSNDAIINALMGFTIDVNDNNSIIDVSNASGFTIEWTPTSNADGSETSTISKATYYSSITEYKSAAPVAATPGKDLYIYSHNDITSINYNSKKYDGIILTQKNTDYPDEYNGTFIGSNYPKTKYTSTSYGVYNNTTIASTSSLIGDKEYIYGLVFAGKNNQLFEEGDIRIKITAPNGQIKNIDLPRFYMGEENTWIKNNYDNGPNIIDLNANLNANSILLNNRIDNTSVLSSNKDYYYILDSAVAGNTIQTLTQMKEESNDEFITRVQKEYLFPTVSSSGWNWGKTKTIQIPNKKYVNSYAMVISYTDNTRTSIVNITIKDNINIYDKSMDIFNGGTSTGQITMIHKSRLNDNMKQRILSNNIFTCYCWDNYNEMQNEFHNSKLYISSETR